MKFNVFFAYSEAKNKKTKINRKGIKILKSDCEKLTDNLMEQEKCGQASAMQVEHISAYIGYRNIFLLDFAYEDKET